jgi:hypothetical protein
MFTHVILKATHGELKGRQFVLPDGASCVLGRVPDGSAALPDTRTRHHCAIAVEAPAVCLWDLSGDGACVNGEKIGQREWWQIVEEVPVDEEAAHPLCDGDEFQAGGHTFLVEFWPRAGAGAEAEVRDPGQFGSCESGSGV